MENTHENRWKLANLVATEMPTEELIDWAVDAIMEKMKHDNDNQSCQKSTGYCLSQ